MLPATSTALADSACGSLCPSVVSQRYVYGASSVVAIDSPSIKNSTKDIPLSSFASTVKLTVPATVCPFVGLDMTTIGGLVSLGILFTYTLTDGTSKYYQMDLLF